MSIPQASATRGAVVANPGSLRWFLPMASALAEAGLLRVYAAPVAQTATLADRVGRLPRRLSHLIDRELQLRPVPDHVDERAVHLTGTLSHLGLVALSRKVRSPVAIERATALTLGRFDRAAARLPQHGDLGVIASSGAALETLRSASRRGVRGILDYPIAHHRLSERLLGDEARALPEYTATLQFWSLPRAIRTRLEAEIEAADTILLNSSFARDSFLDAGVAPEKLTTVQFGVDLEMFTERPHAEDPEARPFRVLFAGQITQRKGISYLAEAFRQAALPDAELIFLGQPVGPAAQLLAGPDVHFWPPVRITELAERYHACDVFVLPSLIEGFPQTAAIAMACGLPVIMSENTSASDVVEDGVSGYVVPIRDPAAIAERLRELHGDPARRLAMGAAARRRISEFTWERYGRGIVELIQGSG